MSAQNIKFSLSAIEARDLLAGDSNGLSDPYFKVPHRQNGIVDLPGKKNRSKTIKKTLNPVWNHTFDMEFNPTICTKLNIEVYDYDLIGKDDLLGTATINLEWMLTLGQDVFEQWIPLNVTIKDKKKGTQNVQKGSVHIKLQVKYRPPNLPNLPPRPPQQTMMQPPPGQPPMMQPGQPPMMQPYYGQSMMQPQYPMAQYPGQQQMMQPSQYSSPPGQQPMMNPPQGQPSSGQLYPSFQQISQAQPPGNNPPSGQPPMANPPPGQPPMTNPPPGQPPMANPPPGQPPMTNPPPGQPPMTNPPPGQPPMTNPPPGQPLMENPPPGQPPMENPPPGQPPMENPPPGQPPITNPPPGQPPMENPSPGQPPITNPPPGQPPIVNPPPGQPPMANPPPGQPPMVNPQPQPPMANPPPGQPPMMNPPPGQPPMMNPPPGQPTLQRTMTQNPQGQPPKMNPPPGQPSLQRTMTQSPPGPINPMFQQPHGQPYPMQQAMTNPPHGQQPPPVQPYPMQPPLGQPYPMQPPPGQQYPMQPPPGQPYPMQPPHGQPYPMQPPPGQPYPMQPPPGQPYPMQPPHGQPYPMQPPHNPPRPMFQSTITRPPPQHSMFQQPLPGQPPMIRPPPAQHSMMQPPIMMPGIQQPPRIPIIDHRRGDALQPGSWIQVNEPLVMVGLGWDFTGRETFDLDASITAFDHGCEVIESIYFSNKRGLNGSVIHMGDNTTGEGEGDDEVIKVFLHKIPKRVHFLAVTINSYNKNSLIKARSAYIRLFTNNYHLGKYVLNRTKDCIGLLLGVFERNLNQNSWYFRVMADPISGNKVTLSYNDIKTLLGSYSIDSYNSAPTVQHPLPGEPIIEFNKWIKLQNRFTYVGLGWNIQRGLNFDLDASIITFGKMNNLMEIIYHKNMRSYDGSIIHCGDNRTGAGEGDDEVLSVDFAKVNPNVFTMAVIINSFKGNSMVHILNAFIRLYDTQRPIGVHVLNNCPDCIGLFFGIFRKDEHGIWYFTAIKEIVRGIVATESVNDVGYLLNKYPLKI